MDQGQVPDNIRQQKSITGTLDRSRHLTDRAEKLAVAAKDIADRLEGTPSPPTGAHPETPEKAYGTGLTDSFLSINDKLDRVLDGLDVSLARINNIV